MLQELRRMGVEMRGWLADRLGNSQNTSFVVSFAVHGLALFLLAQSMLLIGEGDPTAWFEGHWSTEETLASLDRVEPPTAMIGVEAQMRLVPPVAVEEVTTKTAVLPFEPDNPEEVSLDDPHGDSTTTDPPETRADREPDAAPRKLQDASKLALKSASISPQSGRLRLGSEVQTPPTTARKPLHGLRPDEDPVDKVVAEFIRYDIGELTGPAGLEARRKFEELGASAIPSLVRGLNESAGIAASCPVVVISNRLMNAISVSQNSQYLPYALRHLGEGVKPHAPHWARIRSCLDELAELAPHIETMDALARSESTTDRATALRHLALHPRVYSQCGWVRPLIQEMLNAQEEDVRADAVKARNGMLELDLEQALHRAEDPAKAVDRLLWSDDLEQQWVAVQSLGRINPGDQAETAARLLEPMLDSPDERIAADALKSIVNLCRADLSRKEKDRELEVSSFWAKHSQRVVRLAATAEMGENQWFHDPAFSTLLDDDDPEVAMAAVTWFFPYLTANMQYWIENDDHDKARGWLDHPNAVVREAAQKAVKLDPSKLVHENFAKSLTPLLASNKPGTATWVEATFLAYSRDSMDPRGSQRQKIALWNEWFQQQLGEREAARWLRLGRQFVEKRKPDSARGWWRKAAEKHPETPSGREAQALLDAAP